MMDPDEPLPWYVVAALILLLACGAAAFIIVIGSALGWWSLT